MSKEIFFNKYASLTETNNRPQKSFTNFFKEIIIFSFLFKKLESKKERKKEKNV